MDVRKAIRDRILSRRPPNKSFGTIYGVPIEELDREELIAALWMLKEDYEQKLLASRGEFHLLGR